MDTALFILSMINDLMVIFLNCILFINLTQFKKETTLYKVLIYGGCVAFGVAYTLGAYVFKLPYSVSTTLFMSIPSFILFLILSKYKNARFFVTFCFVDTVTLILASLCKFANIKGGLIGQIIAIVVVLVIIIFTFIKFLPICPKYKELLKNVKYGWNPMAISTLFIYIYLVACAMYPIPLVDRPEYMPLYLLLCATILIFYVVFIVLIKEKAKLINANQKLKEQQHWHELAYSDELTKLANKAAYDKKIFDMSQNVYDIHTCYILMIDIDDFKIVNDTYGHLVGDEVLKQVANYFLSTFPKEHFEFFRIGGDEFVSIVQNYSKPDIKDAVNQINTKKSDNGYTCTLSCGYSKIDLSEKKPFEQAFFRADKLMYDEKARKKKMKNNQNKKQ